MRIYIYIYMYMYIYVQLYIYIYIYIQREMIIYNNMMYYIEMEYNLIFNKKSTIQLNSTIQLTGFVSWICDSISIFNLMDFYPATGLPVRSAHCQQHSQGRSTPRRAGKKPGGPRSRVNGRALSTSQLLQETSSESQRVSTGREGVGEGAEGFRAQVGEG